jgi:hypothetical protein
MPTPQRLLVLTRGEKAIETKSKRRVGVFCGRSFRRHGALTAKRVVGVLLISRTWGNFERTDADPQRLLVLIREKKAIETKSKRRVGVFYSCSFRRHGALTVKRVVGVLLISRTWGNFERTDADPQR